MDRLTRDISSLLYRNEIGSMAELVAEQRTMSGPLGSSGSLVSRLKCIDAGLEASRNY